MQGHYSRDMCLALSTDISQERIDCRLEHLPNNPDEALEVVDALALGRDCCCGLLQEPLSLLLLLFSPLGSSILPRLWKLVFEVLHRLFYRFFRSKLVNIAKSGHHVIFKQADKVLK